MTTPVIQATAWYPPHGIGGTENYLAGLVAGLAARDIPSRIILPRPDGAPSSYDHQGAQVQTYAVNATPSESERQGAAHAGFESFLALLKGAAIYHQHSWTRGLGAHHLRAARRIGLKTILTVHVPSPLCLRGTMMRFGDAACDGFIEAGRCGACWAQSRGAPRPVAELLSHLPLARPLSGQGRFATALGARPLAQAKREAFDEMVDNADRIVAVCQWLYDALLLNGVPQQKLVLSRQGVSQDFFVVGDRRPAPGEALRLLYLGRWHPSKGIHIIVKALRLLPSDVAVELTIHGLAAGAEEKSYQAEVEKIAAADPRIRIKPPLPAGEVARALADFDVLLVPSQVLETGPLVVLEGQAAGLFIIGSRLGGIAELVGDAGILLPPADIAAWADAIGEAARRPRPLATPSKVRTMDEVAGDMAAIYGQLGEP